MNFLILCTINKYKIKTHPSGQMSQSHMPVLLVKNPGAHDFGWSEPNGQCKPIGHTTGFGTMEPV